MERFVLRHTFLQIEINILQGKQSEVTNPPQNGNAVTDCLASQKLRTRVPVISSLCYGKPVTRRVVNLTSGCNSLDHYLLLCERRFSIFKQIIETQ